MASNWYLYNKKKENIKQIVQKFGISPLTSVILCNREIYDENEINKILSSDLNDLNNPNLLPDIDKAANILHDYILAKKKIRIIGDYDIDGVCSTYVLYDAINKIGGDVSYAIPDRFADGYGINTSLIDKAIEDKIDLIITCDNGIAAGEQITYAKKNGIATIVTDHHDITEIPVDAVAIIDPKRIDLDNKYPFDGICGCVVAWKFMIRYYELYEGNKEFIIDNYLEFVMMATIGDIMPLVNENHIIAKLGLKKIVTTKNKGLLKLLEITEIDFQTKGVNTYHIGFIIGPLINAAGRMDKATLALKLFLSDDEQEIFEISSTLKKLNDERKILTENGIKFAISQVEDKYKDNKVLVLFIDNLGEQVAGIVAGRIKEKYNKPTIVLTDSTEYDEAKASCRSIEGYNIFESLNRHKDMFIKFGGHKLAAGFSILKSNIDKLRIYLNNECSLKEVDFIPKIHIDAEYPFYDFNTDLINDIEKLEPFGQGFQKPVFATKNCKCTIKNIYGKDNNVIHIMLNKDNFASKGVAFMDSEVLTKRLKINDTIDIVYMPKINEFRGVKSIEINILDYR